MPSSTDRVAFRARVMVFHQAWRGIRQDGASLAVRYSRWDFSTYWVYAVGSLIGMLVAVAVARFLRGPAKASEANAAMGNPLDS